MSNLENNFSIYPYGYENELVEKRGLRESEARHRNELADKLSVDMGVIAMAAITGIAGPEYKETTPSQSPMRSRMFGETAVSHLVSIDRAAILSPMNTEQSTTINERAVLGYAERQAA